MRNDEAHSAPLHLHSVDFVGGVENVEDVLDGDVHFEVLLAVRLKAQVGELIEKGGSEEVERVLWRHVSVTEVNVAQQALEGFRGGYGFANCDLEVKNTKSLNE